MAVEQSVYLDCAPERAFAAFTSPTAILSWWDDDKSYRTREWNSDLRPGGASGEYLVVDPPHAVEWSWRADWDDVLADLVRQSWDTVRRVNRAADTRPSTQEVART